MPVDYLFIVRHGETEANVEGIEAGSLDYRLTRKGRKDARFIAKTLSKIEIRAVYSSPVFRAVETAGILAEPHDLKVKPLDELTEAKIKSKFVGKKGRHHILESPDAFDETNDELLARTTKAFEIIKKEANGNVIVVSHGDVISAMLEKVVERKITTQRYYVMHPEPASLCVIDVKGRPFLMLYNYRRKMFSGF